MRQHTATTRVDAPVIHSRATLVRTVIRTRYTSLNAFFKKFIHNKEAESVFAHSMFETSSAMRLMPLHRPAIRTLTKNQC